MGITSVSGPLDASEVELSMGFEQMLAHQFPGRSNTDTVEDDGVVIRGKCPGLPAAMARVHELRSGDVTAGDLLKVAKLARRFSFNRYH